MDGGSLEVDFCLQDRTARSRSGDDDGDEVAAVTLTEEKPGRAPRNYEDVVRVLGPPGRYQVLQCLMLGVIHLPVVLVRLNFVFIGLEPPFLCSPVNETKLFQEHTHTTTQEMNTTTHQAVYGDCEIRITSNTSGTVRDVDTFGCYGGYTYKGGKHVSVVTEWDLVCDRRGTAELTQISLSVGLLLGSVVSSIFSDKFGRKIAIAMVVFFSSISELCCGFAGNIYIIIVLRFISGFFISRLLSISFILGAEMLVSKDRETFGVYYGMMWSFGTLLLCGVGYIFREKGWRDLQLCLAICELFMLVLVFFVDESPSWLYSKGKYKKAARIIRKACRFNGIDYNTVKPTWEEVCAQGNTNLDTENKAAKDYNAFDLFRNRKLRASVLIAWVLAFTNDVSFIGLYLSAPALAGNLYLNTSLMAVLEIPGSLCVLLMLKHKGRRVVTMFFMSLGAVFLLVYTCVLVLVVNDTQHTDDISIAFFLLARFAISNSFSTIFIYIPELFPTTLRASSVGICLTGGCLGGMVAPYLLPLHHIAQWAPGTLLIGALTISTLLTLKLPETRGRQLESSI